MSIAILAPLYAYLLALPLILAALAALILAALAALRPCTVTERARTDAEWEEMLRAERDVHTEHTLREIHASLARAERAAERSRSASAMCDALAALAEQERTDAETDGAPIPLTRIRRSVPYRAPIKPLAKCRRVPDWRTMPAVA